MPRGGNAAGAARGHRQQAPSARVRARRRRQAGRPWSGNGDGRSTSSLLRKIRRRASGHAMQAPHGAVTTKLVSRHDTRQSSESRRALPGEAQTPAGRLRAAAPVRVTFGTIHTVKLSTHVGERPRSGTRPRSCDGVVVGAPLTRLRDSRSAATRSRTGGRRACTCRAAPAAPPSSRSTSVVRCVARLAPSRQTVSMGTSALPITGGRARAADRSPCESRPGRRAPCAAGNHRPPIIRPFSRTSARRLRAGRARGHGGTRRSALRARVREQRRATAVAHSAAAVTRAVSTSGGHTSYQGLRRVGEWSWWTRAAARWRRAATVLRLRRARAARSRRRACARSPSVQPRRDQLGEQVGIRGDVLEPLHHIGDAVVVAAEADVSRRRRPCAMWSM